MGKDIELAILFADVVGSTRIYEVMGDLRARDMVLTCVEIMRSATGSRESPLSGARLRSVGMHGPDQRDRAGAYPQVVQVLGLGEGSGAL